MLVSDSDSDRVGPWTKGYMYVLVNTITYLHKYFNIPYRTAENIGRELKLAI